MDIGNWILCYTAKEKFWLDSTGTKCFVNHFSACNTCYKDPTCLTVRASILKMKQLDLFKCRNSNTYTYMIIWMER